VIGLGTAPIGGLYSEVSEEDAVAVVERAWDLGVRWFDTAPFYGSGLAEHRLGKVLRHKPRDDFVVSTKVGRLFEVGESGWHGAPRLKAYFDFSYDGALRSFEDSLVRLALDRVDVVFVHDPEDHQDEALTGAFPALDRLRDEGVVRAIGFGMNYVEPLIRFVREADPNCLLVAGRYTLLDRSAADELLPLCEERRIDVLAGGVFNSGVLADGDAYDYAPAPPEVRERVAALRETCSRFDVPLAAAAMQFPLRHPAVRTVLVGCRSVAELEEDVELSERRLPDALWAEL
jgi:D-threo-aldose 1-dehydrogenase